MPIATSSLPYRRNVGLMVINRPGPGLARPPHHAARHAPAPQTGGWWQMPQGGIDDGEDPRAAALRELEEETGMRSAAVIAESADWHNYDLPPDLLGRALGGRYRGQTQKWFLLRFTGRRRRSEHRSPRTTIPSSTPGAGRRSTSCRS